MTWSAIIAISALTGFALPLGFALGRSRSETPGGGDPSGEAESPTAEGAEAEPQAEKRCRNRLAKEPSLYLRMHAHNPVDWYPWGRAALTKARTEGKLIFLSIGYSSCYWCHVMERKTFTDVEVAKLLNEHYVSIKVDREERPDLDEIYMTALHVYFRLIRSPQSGGWPLTMFLTPDAKPLLGGTYFPPRDTGGQRGLLAVLDLVQRAWEEKPEQLRENADVLSDLVRRQLQAYASPAARLDPGLLDDAMAALIAQYDPRHGGFGFTPFNPQQPKFPQPSSLAFLADRARRDRAREGHGDGKDAGRAESMLVTTLERMAAGGIRDHLGGGFHRYSTDRFWHVPHFEKMLYDNGQLASVYAEAHRLTGDLGFRRTAEDVCDFVLREMTGPDGQFYSAIDAETDGHEGAYYVWQRDELARILSDEELRLLTDAYAIDERADLEGRCVLRLARPLRETAAARGSSEEQLRRRLAAVHQKLLETQARRSHPRTDTKVLTAWNGLMIRGMADAGRLLDRPEYTQAAEAAAGFALKSLRTPEGRLLRTHGNDRAPLYGYLDDYAFLVDGLIGLHEGTGRPRWLEEADRLTGLQIEWFWDETDGGFFFTSSDHEALIARGKEPVDSALPSANAVSAGSLVYLAGQLGRPDYLDRAERTLRGLAGMIGASPGSAPRMAVALAALLKARDTPTISKAHEGTSGPRS